MVVVQDTVKILAAHGWETDSKWNSWWLIPTADEDGNLTIALVDSLDELGEEEVVIDDSEVLRDIRKLFIDSYVDYLKPIFGLYLVVAVDEHIKNLEEHLVRGGLEKIYSFSQDLFFRELVTQTQMGAVELEIAKKREEADSSITYRIERLFETQQNQPILQLAWQEQVYGNNNAKNIVFLKAKDAGGIEYGLLKEGDAIHWWDGNSVLEVEFSPDEIKKVANIKQVIEKLKSITMYSLYYMYEREDRAYLVDTQRETKSLPELFNLVNGEKGKAKLQYHLKPLQWSAN